MKKIPFLLLTIVLNFNLSFSQIKSEIDSLLNEISKTENSIEIVKIEQAEIEITDSQGETHITDLEFENFENLICEMRIDQTVMDELKFEQAISNKSSMNFNIYLLSVLLIFLIINTIWKSGYHLIILVFLLFNGILLYGSIKRKLEYKRTIENRLQTKN